MNAKDPVCGMEVEPDEAAGQSDYQGKTYYFCCNECKRKFDQNPQAFVKQTQKAGSNRADGAVLAVNRVPGIYARIPALASSGTSRASGGAVIARGRDPVDIGLGRPAGSAECGLGDLPVAAVAGDRDRAELIGAQEGDIRCV